MKHILVVDSEASFLETVTTGFKAHKQRYKLYTADNGRQAALILKKEPIDFVITDLYLPKVDDRELLVYIRKQHPLVPIAVTTSYHTPALEETLLKKGIINILIKPVSMEDVIRCIDEALSQTAPQGLLEGISIVNFLQFIEMEGKTYLLEVQNEAQTRGLFYFQEGVLIDALCGELTGEPAALEMITWENIQISYRNLPKQKIRQRIKKKLMTLLMEGVTLKDQKKESQTEAGNSSKETTADAFDNFLSDDEDKTIMLQDEELILREPEPATSPEPPEADSEVLEMEEGSGQSPHTVTDMDIQKGFQEIINIQGVKAVGLIGMGGEVIESAGAWLGADLAKLGMSVAMVYNGASQMGTEIKINRLKTLTFESKGATIMCSPVGETLLIVVAPNSKNLGIIRQKVKKLMPVFQD